MVERLILKIGETKRFRRGIFTGVSLMYCGMPDEKTFCLGIKQASGYRGYGLNLYFPIERQMIEIKEIKLNIVHVKPDQITVERIQ